MLHPLLAAALDTTVVSALGWLCALPDALLEALNARIYVFVDGAKKESELREDEGGRKLESLLAKKEEVGRTD